jgi:hypothetical protein
VSEKDKARIVDAYHKAMPIMEDFHGCSACGVRDPRRSTTRYTFKNLPAEHCFMYDDGATERYEKFNAVTLELLDEDDKTSSTRTIKLSKLISSFEHNGIRFHFHPELVEKDVNKEPVAVFLCSMCGRAATTENAKPPKMSVAGGVDYGSLARLGIAFPSAAEELVLAEVRIYSLVNKVHLPHQPGLVTARSALHGHTIAFFHDGPETIARSFNQARFDDVLDHIMVTFVGPNGTNPKFEQLMLQYSNVAMRPRVLLNLLQVRNAIHCLQHNESLFPEMITEENLVKWCDHFKRRLKTDCLDYVGNDDVERASHPSDIANVRNTDDVDVECNVNVSCAHDTSESPHEVDTTRVDDADVHPSIELQSVAVYPQRSVDAAVSILQGAIDVLHRKKPRANTDDASDNDSDDDGESDTHGDGDIDGDGDSDSDSDAGSNSNR